jgi:hypothetical protein
MNRTVLLKRLGALAIAGALTIAAAGPALAATGPTSTATAAPTVSGSRFARLQAACEKAINNRLGSITEATTAVKAAAHLTAGDRDSLLAQIGQEQSGLSALLVKIEGDTDLATLRTDCKDIVAEYHWYVIGLPKVHLTIAADDAVALAQVMKDLSARLQAAIDRARQHGRNVAQAQSDENALTTAISSALAAASPVPAMVLPLGFENWTAAQPVLQAARSDLGTARTDFVAGRSDARKVVADLKALRPSPSVTATATAG